MTVTVEDFKGLIGKKVKVLLRGSNEVSGELREGYNRVIMLVTDKGSYFYDVYDVVSIVEDVERPAKPKRVKSKRGK